MSFFQKMPTINEDAEKIMKESILLLKKLNEGKLSKDEVELLLRDIIHTCKQLLSDEQEALKRIGMHLQEIFGDERKAQTGLGRLGLDFKELFK